MKMKFLITKTARKASEPRYQEVEIKTIDELLILVKAYWCSIIVDYNKSNYWDKEIAWRWTLEVYNDYRE